MGKFRWIIMVVVLAVAFLSVGLPAAAHGYIVRAIPEDRATLERAPARVQYWFSEDLEPEFSSLLLRDQSGAVLVEGGVSESSQAMLTLRVPNALPDGAYIVELRPAFSSDGHVSAETRVFFVGAEVGGIAGSSSYQVIALEIVWRVLLLAAVMLLLGVFAIYTAVLVPAWGSTQYPAGLLPPRVMQALNRLVIAALVVAFAGNIVALLQQSMAFFGVGLGEVLAQGLWNVVRIGSRFGDVWNGRMFLLLLVAVLHGLSIYFRDHQQNLDWIHRIWVGNVWLMALTTGTFSITSHAAGSLLLPWVGVVIDWLHASAVGVWVGGLAALVLILPVALRPYTGEQRRLALLAALRRFSRLAVGALAVVIASGVYSSLNWLNEPAELTGTAWGGALLIKILLVGVLLALGAVHRIAANPERYSRFSHFGQLAVTLRLEVIVAVGVLIAVANLSATPVPEPKFLEASAPALSGSQTVGNYTVDLTVSPGGAGVNTFDIQVTPADNIDVAVQIVNPLEDRRGAPMVAEAIDSDLFVVANGDLDGPGRWWTLVDIRQGDTLNRVAFAWDVTGTALPTRSPTLLNGLALIGVIVACIVAIWPALRRLYRWLDWSPASVTTASAATVITGVFLVLGYIVVQRGEADYQATINPPPQIVNTVLPDQASLNLGESLFAANCAWNPTSRDLNRLRTRLPELRDEALFAITQSGWQGLPACDPNLNQAERWHIVNYWRTWL